VAGATVSAQEAGKRLINAAMSGKTLDSVVAQMKQEMGYAKEGWSAASDYVLGRMGGGEFSARGEAEAKPYAGPPPRVIDGVAYGLVNGVPTPVVRGASGWVIK
jgi:hypothetical protein